LARPVKFGGMPRGRCSILGQVRLAVRRCYRDAALKTSRFAQHREDPRKIRHRELQDSRISLCCHEVQTRFGTPLALSKVIKPSAPPVDEVSSERSPTSCAHRQSRWL
jgi:hypothetical protein